MSRWIFIWLLFMFQCLTGQEYQSRIYQAYLDGHIGDWKSVIDQMESEFNSSSDMDLLYELTEAQYGYIAFCISVKKKKEAEAELKKVDNYLERLLKFNNNDPRVYSLKGAFYGLSVGLEPFKAPVYGRRAEKAVSKAINLGPEEPQAWMEKANGEFYKPAVFGGSKERAVSLYEKAVKLFESKPGGTRENWLYLNCLAGLGIAFEETDQLIKAGRVYRKLLDLEPSFSWIRDEVYPQYLEKLSQN